MTLRPAPAIRRSARALSFALLTAPVPRAHTDAAAAGGDGGAAERRRQLEATPDRPWSLFEGVAGLAVFLAALLDPQDAPHLPRVTGAAAPNLM
jgi:hypothetical protein